MANELIREKLDAVARERGAGDADLWPRVASRVRHGERRGSGAQSEWMPLPGGKRAQRPRFHFGISGLAVALMVVLGVALAWWLGRTPLSEPTSVGDVPVAATATPSVSTSTEPVDLNWGFEGHDNIYRLSTYIGKSQAIGGHTVTLERAYADGNSIVLFYSTGRNAGVKLTSMFEKLTLPDGREVRHYYGGQATSAISRASGELENARDYSMIAFDAQGVGPLPDKLSLTFGFDAIASDEYPAARATVEAYSKLSEKPQDQWLAFTEKWREFTSPVAFSFEVPVTKEGVRVLELNQTVDVKGERLTLERVVITPVELRATLRYDMAEAVQDKFIRRSTIWLFTGDPEFDSKQQVPPMGYGHRVPSGDNLRMVHSIIWPFNEMHGEWTLNVYGLELARIEGAVNPADYPPPKAITGQWEFKFTVPPLEK